MLQSESAVFPLKRTIRRERDRAGFSENACFAKRIVANVFCRFAGRGFASSVPALRRTGARSDFSIAGRFGYNAAAADAPPGGTVDLRV